MGIAFIHTADWQLGKPFSRFEDTLAGRLQAERQDVIVRIAQAATERDCAHILVAGDIWDTTLPGDPTLFQPLDIMAEWAELTWWLMPGNHDRDDSDGLWDRIAARNIANVRLLRRAEPVQMAPHVWILPAPWQRLHHGTDLTEWMADAETPESAIRIGMAHGGIRNFGSNDHASFGETAEIISPDRAETARLDYLALGDWHARTAVNPRTHYPGTPEPDRHKDGARGQVLHVEIEAPGATPQVTEIPTGRYDWPRLDISLQVDQMPTHLELIHQTLSGGAPERNTLVDLHLSGATTLAEWSSFETAIETLRGRCAHLSIRGEDDVSIQIVPGDLNALDQQGSVRAAAETLQSRRDDAALSQAERDIAGDALRILLSYPATAS